MYCLVNLEGVIGRQERYGIVDFGIVEDFWGDLIERFGRLFWLCNCRMSVTNAQIFEALLNTLYSPTVFNRSISIGPPFRSLCCFFSANEPFPRLFLLLMILCP